ncbi:MAG: helix-turn-helix domain-containing protein [Betaproteobacteria bacterium]|nr:helix-turn-helix domain-containing protein [Betaproteobacteria bacterium]
MCHVVDTSALPPDHRIEHWQRMMLQFFCAEVRVFPHAGHDFQAVARTHSFGAIRLMQFEGEAFTLSCAMTGDGPELVALVPVSGRCIVRSGGEPVGLEPGSLGVLDTGKAVDLEFPGTFRLVAVGVPGHRLPAFQRRRSAGDVVRMDATAESPALFVAFVTALARFHESLDTRENIKTTDTVVELLNGSLRRHFGSRVTSKRDQHHRDRIEKLVEKELRNPALDIAFISRSVGLSARHVHRLFSEDTVSLTQWILEQRLDSCFQELSQDAASTRTIGEIAYSWGFNDQAHFSRTFRKRFGTTPSALRAGRSASDPS